MKKELIMPAAFECLGGRDVMPIRAGFGPYPPDGRVPLGTFPEFISDEYFQAMADMGINFIGAANCPFTTKKEWLIKSLELAGKYGMGYMLKDPELYRYVTEEENPDIEWMKERIANYSHYPAFGGVHVVDEPTSPIYRPNPNKYISNYVKLVDMLREIKISNFQCLLPVVNYDLPNIPENYRAYIEEYCEAFKPGLLLYDHYPFVDKAPRFDVYFWNMDVIREYAKKYEIPFGVVVQAGGQWNDNCEHFDSIPYYPNEGQFDWNVNTCLAMGAKVISYFPVMQPVHFAWAKSEEYDFERNGIFGCNGQKNRWYYYAQRMNRQIAAIDEVLMLSVNEGLIASGKSAKEALKLTDCVLKNGTFRELTAVTGEAIIGCFDFEGKTALYVVNHDMETSQKILLTFNQMTKLRMIKNAENSYVNTDAIELDMAAGEGVLLVIG